MNRTLTSGTNLDIRGFKSDYDMTVKHNGVPVKVDSFSLTGNEVTVTISLGGNEGKFLQVNFNHTHKRNYISHPSLISFG